MRYARDELKSPWSRLKTFMALVALAFVVTLGLVAGNRLSDEALGVLAGAACGVGAAIPTSLIVLAVTRRRGGGEPRQPTASGQNPYPPVVVVSPPASRQHAAHDWISRPPSLSAPRERDFTVVGGKAACREGIRYDDECRS
jgi:hypothetical protein